MTAVKRLLSKEGEGISTRKKKYVHPDKVKYSKRVQHSYWGHPTKVCTMELAENSTKVYGSFNAN